MNKEVKEIKEHLDFAREVFDYTLNPDQCGLLLDYINQLEKENEQFQQANVEFVSQNNKLQHRIYEAIEYIKGTWTSYCEQDAEWLTEVQNTLLEILKGGSNE